LHPGILTLYSDVSKSLSACFHHNFTLSSFISSPCLILYCLCWLINLSSMFSDPNCQTLNISARYYTCEQYEKNPQSYMEGYRQAYGKSQICQSYLRIYTQDYILISFLKFSYPFLFAFFPFLSPIQKGIFDSFYGFELSKVLEMQKHFRI
jgi:hypothetical protein